MMARRRSSSAIDIPIERAAERIPGDPRNHSFRERGERRRTHLRQMMIIGEVMSDEVKSDEMKSEKLPTTAETPRLDGFEGFSDEVEGGDERQTTGRVIQGQLLRFTNEAKWVVADEVLPPDLELIAIGVGRVVQKWKDGKPVETIILAPGQKFPDVEKLNAEVPQSEWEEGPDGKSRGPWQAQYVVYLLDPHVKMDRYSYPTGTTGGGIAVRDLVDKTQLMRKFRGANLYPVVRLSATFMPTRYGGRQRPHFIVVKWITLDSGDKALPAPEQPKLPSQGAREVKPPSAKEVTGDEVRF
jgi:hypothetical protein